MPHPSGSDAHHPIARQRRSALQSSALDRLACVAAPIAVLWLFVAFALDVFA